MTISIFGVAARLVQSIVHVYILSALDAAYERAEVRNVRGYVRGIATNAELFISIHYRHTGPIPRKYCGGDVKPEHLCYHLK